VHDFFTTQLGGRLATSVGGVLTGRGADFIIIDDPMKPDDALSDTRRATANEWFDNTLRSRLNNKTKGCIIIVMQRLHQDDLVGHVLEKEKWKVLSFPAVAEEDEVHAIKSPLGHGVLSRKRDDVLNPEWEPLLTINGIRQALGEYNYLAQHQQDPAPIGGVMVKRDWFNYYLESPFPRQWQIIQSWDTANKATQLNDFSVCTTWCFHEKRFYLLDVFRQRLNYPDLRRAVVELAKRHRAYTVLIEDKASGTHH